MTSPHSSLVRVALSMAVLLFVLACGSPAARPASRPSSSTKATAKPTPSAPARSTPQTPVESAPSAPTLIITDRPTLRALEIRGLGLTTLLGRSADQADDNRTLSELSSARVLTRVIAEDARRATAEDSALGVEVRRFPHRLFDVRFLSSEHARFELAAVVNRLDRLPFAEGSCGETRLIYRLRYEHDRERASKLPMTLGIELTVATPEGGCSEVARRWIEASTTSADERAEFLTSARGPLAPSLIQLDVSTRVVINLQLVRWPSTVRPDLGGHAEYLLRSFRPDVQGILQVERLENTIDPGRLGANGGERAALLAFLQSDRGASLIADGTTTLPERFLAERSFSVTPRGLARLSNRPFTSALRATDMPSTFAADSLVQSQQAALRRLDQLSCNGCHAARSVAGFHVLGEDEPTEPAENALASPLSAHLQQDLERRRGIVQALLEGSTPDFRVPFAEHAALARTEYGAHCDLGRDPTFASWTCAPGLTCSDFEMSEGEPVGQCLPAVRGVGDACERGAVIAHRDRRRDRIANASEESCGTAVCNRSRVGFPGGMCTASCGDAGAKCGSLAILDSFNACLARNESFLSCIRGNVTPAGFRACNAATPCRDDYVCARTNGGGVCIPPYFVFQLRVDGHSLAKARRAER